MPLSNAVVNRLFRGANGVVLIASAVGLSGFLYPFLLPSLKQNGEDSARAADAPYLLAAITALCLVAIVAELGPDRHRGGASKTVALLGSLVAIDAGLRVAPTF